MFATPQCLVEAVGVLAVVGCFWVCWVCWVVVRLGYLRGVRCAAPIPNGPFLGQRLEQGHTVVRKRRPGPNATGRELRHFWVSCAGDRWLHQGRKTRQSARQLTAVLPSSFSDTFVVIGSSFGDSCPPGHRPTSPRSRTEGHPRVRGARSQVPLLMAPPLHVVALVMALVCVSGSVAVTALRAPRWSPWARPSSAHVALAATTSEKPGAPSHARGNTSSDPGHSSAIRSATAPAIGQRLVNRHYAHNVQHLTRKSNKQGE